MTTNKAIAALAGWTLGAALTACGGGGGTPATTVTPTPTPTVHTATPTPSPTPSAVPSGDVTVTGMVTDEETYGTSGGAPVAGATVTLAGGFQSVPNPSPSPPIASVTTASDGTFTITLSAAQASAVTVVIAAGSNAGPTTAPLHRTATVASTGSTSLGDLQIATPNADETSGFAALNADRVTLGPQAWPSQATLAAMPLGWDADMVRIARYRAHDMATRGYFSHCDPGNPNCLLPFQAAMYSLLTALPNYLILPGACNPGENIAAGVSNLVAAEAGYAAEGPTGGHVMNLTAYCTHWVGLGAAYNGAAPYGNYFVEDFN